MRIGELAKRTGVNPKTLRYWEEVGLLPEPPRDSSGYRDYPEGYEKVVLFILKAKSIGFTLEEIKEVLNVRFSGERPCGCVEEKLKRKVAEIEELIEELEKKKRLLLSLLEGGRKEPAFVCPIIESIG